MSNRMDEAEAMFPANHPFKKFKYLTNNNTNVMQYQLGSNGWVNMDSNEHDIEGIAFGFAIVSNNYGYGTMDIDLY